MNPGASAGAEQGHKTLAAIVFTDVVGFAHHANTDEQRALSCLHRDMEIMKDVCARTNGAVLKTMGDGMLMRFPSAIQALQCALEVQRIFHEQTKRLSTGEVLWHRIGVHLGDVVTTENDVYGDGVNVAARLQAEAKPGSIYLSRTVYDVVKGKMNFTAVYVGPRHLKGISEPVAVWEVPPIGRLELDKRQAALMAMNMPNMPEFSGGIRGARGVAVVIVSILLLVVASTMLYMGAQRAAAEKLVSHRKNPPKPPPDDHQKTESTTGSVANSTSGKTEPTPDAASQDPLSDDALKTQLIPLMAHYDYSGMAAAVQASPYAGTDAGKKLIDRYTKLNSFMGWFNYELDTTTADHRVTIDNDADRGNVPADIYRVGSGYVAITTRASTSTEPVNKLTPTEITAVAAVLMDFPGATEQVSRAELEQDCTWLQADAAQLRSP